MESFSQIFLFQSANERTAPLHFNSMEIASNVHNSSSDSHFIVWEIQTKVKICTVTLEVTRYTPIKWELFKYKQKKLGMKIYITNVF